MKVETLYECPCYPIHPFFTSTALPITKLHIAPFPPSSHTIQ